LLEEYRKATAGNEQKNVSPFLSNEAVMRQFPGLEGISFKALDRILPAYYADALKELGIQPLTFPKIMPQATELGKNCLVEVQVKIEPEIELKQFEGLEGTYTPVIVIEEDIAQQLDGLRKQHQAENDDAKLLANLPFASVDALIEEIRKSLTSMAEEKTDTNKRKRCSNNLLLPSINLSEEIIEQQTMVEFEQIQKQMGRQTMQSYLKSTGQSLLDVQKELRPQAEARVKRNLLLSAVAEEIAAEVTEEDIREALTKQAGLYMDLSFDYEAQLKKIENIPGGLERLRQSILMEKATDYIISKAVLHENEPQNILAVLLNI
jgi:FKBP-type peptidyl-prolyl cis-trans isomerase (trigger factor)